MKMTIHRALAELKLLTNRINKGFTEMRPLGLRLKGGKINNQYDEAEFQKIAEGTVQSVQDLINIRTKLKNAIVKSNAFTIVKIGDVEMTVAQAITEKSFINEKKAYVEVMKDHLKKATGKINLENEKVEANLKTIIEATFGKDAATLKPDQVRDQQVAFRENNQVLLYDPLKIEDKIKSLENEINSFEAEVDATLSESNAITIIEVE